MLKQRAETVRKGYNIIAKAYHEQRTKYESNTLLTKISKLFPKGGSILDLGSGAGVPVAQFLTKKGFAVTGIDFSSSMVTLARKKVSNARFIKMDITKMKFKSDSFDCAVSFYAIIHIPREKHAGIYKKLYRVLKPNGLIFLNASGTDATGWEDYEENYLGTPMFWSFYGPKKTSKLITAAGFVIIWAKVLKLGGERQFWVLAKKK